MEYINKLYRQETLSELESMAVLERITNGIYTDAQIVLILSAFAMRPMTTVELKGFRNALLGMATPIQLQFKNAIDVCGTGGDGKSTFNISTISALVLAAGNYPVIKHGNYGVSSFCGSSTILEQMGYKFRTDEKNLQAQLDEFNICFLHAPLFHPCLKRVSKIRKDLGVRTLFNFLGPLVNPVQPNLQLTGVYDLNVARLYRSVLMDSRTAFGVIHSLDGYDEVSLTAGVKWYSESDEQLIYPEGFTTVKVTPNSLNGGKDLVEAKAIFTRILSGKGTLEQNEVVKANVALGIKCFKPNITIKSAQQEAEIILKSGRALELLVDLIKLSEQ